MVSSLTQESLPGEEAFSAVYRAPGLFWHRPGYEFPGVHGHACRTEVQPTGSQSHFLVSPTRGLSHGPEGPIPDPRGGFVQPHAGGAEILRCTGAFLRGQESFSPSDVTIQPLTFLLPDLPGSGAAPAADIDSSSQPVYLAYPAPCGTRESRRGAIAPDPIWRRGSSAPRPRGQGLDGFTGIGPVTTVIHDSSGLPEGGWIPPGGYPIPAGSPR